MTVQLRTRSIASVNAAPKAQASVADRVANLIQKSSAKPWGKAPTALNAMDLARVIVSSGKDKGALFAAVPDSKGGSLTLWEAKYDAKAKHDVARKVGLGKAVGLADPIKSYAESIPLAPIEKGTPPAVLEMCPSIVRTDGDPNLYVRWPAEGGAKLFLLSTAG